MSTIPASQIVNVQPSVLAAGGSAIDLNGLALTTNTRVPIGTVASFPTAQAVADFFGATDNMALGAAVYFDGYDGSGAKPGALLVAQYPLAAVGAYLRGGDISGLTLAQLQALTPATLSIAIDGVVKSSSINLSAATSFSNAAQIIGNDLAIHGAQSATLTGSIAGTTLTVSAITGSLGVGSVLSGTGVTANTYITALVTGTGATGTYTVSPSQTVISGSMTAFAAGVTYDSISGAFVVVSGSVGTGSSLAFGSGAMATSLLLTSLTGAVLSQGAAAGVPSTFMNAIIAITTNWALFMTSFDPDSGSGFANKLLFSAWADGQNDRYGYVPSDTQVSPTLSAPDTTCFSYAVDQAEYEGTIPVWEPSNLLQDWFVLGWAASIDFEQPNGRATLAFRSQSGLTAGVTDGTIAINLAGNPQVVGDRGNGYNFYGTYGSGNAGFTFMNRGFVSGAFLWADSYVNQIWLNNSLQVALMTYLTQVGSTPFNAAGYAAIEQALSGPIQAGLTFGAFVGGVTLSSTQIAAVNAMAGLDIATTLQQRGWYLQVTPSSAAVRASRGPLAVTFFYVDGQSVQSINLNSVAVQ